MSTRSLIIGVLDIQGSVEEHLKSLRRAGGEARRVKSRADLDEVSGLIIPGGESTTISKLLASTGLDGEIRKRADFMRGMAARGRTGRGQEKMRPLALWGTCAGAILMAKRVLNRPSPTLDLLNITIERNAYGSQQESFETPLLVKLLGKKPLRAIFIRAPRIQKTSLRTTILAELDGAPVAVQDNNLLATMFHPELTDDTRLHEYFLTMTREYAKLH